MAIRIALGDYQTVTDDPLGRDYIGYFPRMTEEETWQAGRGVWKMNRTRAGFREVRPDHRPGQGGRRRAGQGSDQAR